MTKKRRVQIILAASILGVAIAVAVPLILGVWHFHSLVVHAATKSTCSEQGHETYYTCKKCDKIFDEDKKEVEDVPTLAYLPHTFGEYIPNGDETCVHEGTKSATCTKCGAIGTMSVPKLNHTYSALVPAVRETCTKDGMKAHYTCSVCNNYFDTDKKFVQKEELVILAAHKGNGVWQKDAVSHWQLCKVCGSHVAEATHCYDSVNDSSCNDCKMKRDLSRVLVTAYDSMSKVGCSNKNPFQTFSGEVVTLGGEHPSKPEYALDAGNKAVKFHVNKGSWYVSPTLYGGGALSQLDKLDENGYIVIWIYRTGFNWNSNDNWYILGNVNKKNIFNVFNRAGQLFDSKTNTTARGENLQWYSMTFTVKELRNALKKQEGKSAEWMQLCLNVREDCDYYFYSMEYRKPVDSVEVVFDSLEKTGLSIWDSEREKISTTQSIVDLNKEGIGTPQAAMSKSNKAYKISTPEGVWSIERSMYFSDKLNILNNFHDSDYFLVWVYRTGFQWDGNYWMIGNIDQRNGKGNVFNNRSDGQKFDDRSSMNGTGAGGQWYAMKFTVGELKAQLAKQKGVSAEWMLMGLNIKENTSVYFHSIEFHKEYKRAIQVADNAIKKVRVDAKGMPLTDVNIKISGLKFGEAVYVINNATQEEVAILLENGCFKMPCDNVRIEIRNVLNAIRLDDAILSMGSGNVALPMELKAYYDSFSLKVKKDGAEVAKSKYNFDKESGDIVFYEDGVYVLEYTLKRGNNKATLKRNVTAYVYVSSIMDNIDDYARCGWDSEGKTYQTDIVDLTDEGIGIPSEATNVGNSALKVTMNEGKWFADFAIYAGNALKTLSSRNDADYFKIWMYHTGTQWDENLYTLGHLNAQHVFEHTVGQTWDDRGPKFSGTGAGGNWYMLKLSVGDLKAQLAKQGLDACEWIEFRLNYAEKTSFYIYSVEYHQEAPRNITVVDSATAKVSVKASEVALNKVKVQVSNLSYGEAVYVVNVEDNTDIAVLSKTGSFVMPFADVRIEVRDVFAHKLESLTLLRGKGDISLPDTLTAYYDSFSIKVNKDGAAVEDSVYTFDSKKNIIEFKKDGTYLVEYHLKQGDNERTIHRTVTVCLNEGVVTALDDTSKVAQCVSASTSVAHQYSLSVVDLSTVEGMTLPTAVGALDTGSTKALRFSVKDWYLYTAIHLGNELDNLASLNDDDYYVLWVYMEAGQWASKYALVDTYLSGDKSVYDDVYTAGNSLYSNIAFDNATDKGVWVAKKFTVKDLKAQLAKQEKTTAGWLAYLSNFNRDTSPDVYLYSVEFHRAPSDRIVTVFDDTSKALQCSTALTTATYGYTANVVDLSMIEDMILPTTAGAMDTGNTKALKLTINDWHLYTALYLGDELDKLALLDDDDYYVLWVYVKGFQWSNKYALADGYLSDNASVYDNPSGKYTDIIYDADADKGVWTARKFTVKDLKTQLAKQEKNNAGWLAYYSNINRNASPDVYLYSIEFHHAK